MWPFYDVIARLAAECEAHVLNMFPADAPALQATDELRKKKLLAGKKEREKWKFKFGGRPSPPVRTPQPDRKTAENNRRIVLSPSRRSPCMNWGLWAEDFPCRPTEFKRLFCFSSPPLFAPNREEAILLCLHDASRKFPLWISPRPPIGQTGTIIC